MQTNKTFSTYAQTQIRITSEALFVFSFLSCSSVEVLLIIIFCGLTLITLDKLCIVSATTEELEGI